MKKAMSLLLALGMFAAMLAPCAAAEEVTVDGAEAAAVAELAEEAAPEAAEETPVTEEAPAEEAPTEEAPAEEAPVEETVVEEAPVEETVVEQAAEEVTEEVTAAAGDVAINETNFPDEAFRNNLKNRFAWMGTDVITADQIATTYSLDLYDSSIENLKGIEFFTNLMSLNITYTQLSTLDLSKNTELTSLTCYNNQLTSLDISKCTKLAYLSCGTNKLTELDVSNCPALTSLNCYNNKLTSLDVSKCPELFDLSCYTNELTSLDISGCTKLTNLGCSNNKLAALDVSKLTELTSLNCSGNKLTMLDVSGCTKLTNLGCSNNKLTDLDVSKCTELPGLDCSGNELTTLNVSGCTKMTGLTCSNNKLTTLDTSSCEKLTSIYCDHNLFTTLDVSKNEGLTYLNCSDNKLTELKPSGNTKLITLNCSNNQLTALDVSENTKLTTLHCSENKLAKLDVSKNAELKSLACIDNELTTLDISKNDKLGTISCGKNKMATFETTDYTQLQVFSGDGQELEVELKEANGNLQCDLKTIVGKDNLARVSEVKGLGGTYDATTGIISFPKTTVGYVTFSYKYNTNKLRETPMTVIVSANVKDPNAPMKGDSTKTGSFVDRLYETCLNRTADENGKAGWVNQLISYQVSGTKAAQGFVFSKEFQNKKYSNEDYVEHLYQAFMGRASDADGKAGWVKQLKDGKSREEVFYGFANSKEFEKICNDYGIVSKDVETFVTRFYAVCLGRKADAAGLKDWSDKLRSKKSTGRDIAYGFIFSKEFTGKNYSNEDYVEHLYAAFMGRASDAAGKADWVKQLQSGKSREDVFNGFVGSKEFSDICASYDIARG